MPPEFYFFQRSVYGTFKIYPGNENADRFAKLMKVKTFHPADLDDIELLGFKVVEVPDPRRIGVSHA